MTSSTILRRAFSKDVETAMESLCGSLAHLDTKESIDNILHTLTALRIAAITYKEYALQKRVEEILAHMINLDCSYDTKTVNAIYRLVDIMVYPYRNNMIGAA